jgi:PII-like signaling protein/nucleotide-binding universal stress UspA family protein
MFQRILAALENTPDSKSAFEYAVGLARRERAELHVLAVGAIPEVTAGTIDEVQDARRHAQEELAPLLRAAREYAETAGQPVVTEIRFGHAADVITSYAEEHRVDLIVLGKQHRHLGSVVERVIHHTSCPVFVAGEKEVIKYTGPADHRAEDWEVRKDTREKLEGQAKMLRIYIGEQDRWESSSAPLYEAIVRAMRSLDIAGASVFRGIMGYGAQQRVHKTGFLGLSHDLPMLITVVDTEERIQEAIAALDNMVEEGLMVLSDVEVIKYTHTHHELEVAPTQHRRSTDW